MMNPDMRTSSENFIAHGDDVHSAVKYAIDVIDKSVTSTMGPNGRLVLISDGGNAYKVTKDGVTVARSLKFTHPIHEIVGRLMTEAAIKTDVDCGDGTTTTTMLTALLHKIFDQFPGFRNHALIEKYVGRIIHHLGEQTIRITPESPELYHLALTSSNNDEPLTKTITTIYRESNGFPYIEFRKSVSDHDIVQRTAGLTMKMELSNPGYAADRNGGRTNVNEFYPIVVDELLRSAKPSEISDILESFAARVYKGCDPTKGLPHILLIVRGVDHEVNSVIAGLNNKTLGLYNRIIVAQTNFGGSVGTALMGDIATILGTKTYTNLIDVLQDPTPEQPTKANLVIGTGRSLIMDMDEAARARVAERIKGIEESIASADMGEMNSPRVKYQQARIRSLKSELVTVLVGGETDAEQGERMDRYVDVDRAVASALTNGILPGVGLGLIRAGEAFRKELNDSVKGETDKVEFDIVNAILHMTFAPTTHLMGGEDAAEVFDPEVGTLEVTDLTTGEKGTPEELGIYDTAYATITALRGGLKTAKILATLSTVLLGSKLSAQRLS